MRADAFERASAWSSVRARRFMEHARDGRSRRANAGGRAPPARALELPWAGGRLPLAGGQQGVGPGGPGSGNGNRPLFIRRLSHQHRRCVPQIRGVSTYTYVRTDVRTVHTYVRKIRGLSYSTYLCSTVRIHGWRAAYVQWARSELCRFVCIRKMMYPYSLATYSSLVHAQYRYAKCQSLDMTCPRLDITLNWAWRRVRTTIRRAPHGAAW